MTRFSIIIPVYNVEKEIRECLDSIKNQTFTDFEVICVDDCGKDNSIKIIEEEYSSQDPRFKVIKHEHNKGVSAARNTALDAVTGEFLLFVDSDDWIDLNTLEVVNNAIEKHNKDIILHGFYKHHKNNEIKNYGYDFEIAIEINEDNLHEIDSVVCGKIYRTSKIKEIGLKFTEGLVIEDLEFWVKAAVQIKNAYVLKDNLYHYRGDRDGSITTDDLLNERIEDTFIIIERIIDFIMDKGLFNEYKTYILKLITQFSRSVVGTPNKREYIVRTLDKLLTKIDFPNAYKYLDKPKFVFFNN